MICFFPWTLTPNTFALTLQAKAHRLAHVPRGTMKFQPKMIEPDQERADEALQQVLSELGAQHGAVVYVYKHEPEKGTVSGWSIAHRCAVAELDLLDIQERFGGGRYRLDFKNPKGQKIRSVSTSIAEPRRPKTAEPERGAAGGGQDRHGDFLEKMLLAILPGLLNRPSEGLKASDLLAAIREGRESARGGDGGAASFPQILEVFQAGMKIGQEAEAGQSNGGGDVLSVIAPKVLDLLTKALEAPSPNPAPGAAPAPSPVRAVVQQLPASVHELLRQYAPVVLAEARAGRDPYTWGQFVAERTPESLRPLLVAMVVGDEQRRRELFGTIEPRADAAVLDWLDSACEGIGEVLQEQGALSRDVDEGEDAAEVTGAAGESDALRDRPAPAR